MKQRKIKMFKKTLLALSVVAVAGTASAATIYTSVTDVVPTLTGGAGTAFGTNGAALGGDDDCLLAAAVIGVTADLNGKTNGTPGVSGVSDGNDAITLAAQTPNAITTASVVFTANDVCTVIAGETFSTVTAKSPVEAPAGTVTLTASIVSGIGGYAAEDTLTLNFTGAKIDTVNTAAPTLTQRGAAALAILDITDTAIRFTVPAGQTVTTTEILDLAGVVLDSSGLSADTDVSIGMFATNTSGTQYDVTAAAKVHAFVPQYSTKIIRSFDGIINVADDRQSILDEDTTGGTGAANATAALVTTVADHLDRDILAVTITKDSSVNEVVATDITFNVKGDFSWLETAANTSSDGKTATAAEVTTYLNSKDIYSKDGNAFADATTYTLNATLDMLTIKDTAATNAANAAGNYAIRLGVPGKATSSPILNTQSFTVDAVISDGAGTPVNMTALATTSAGAWTLNGSVVTIPYMPFDDNTAVIMRHTNTGVQTGDMTVRYMLEGVSTNWVNAGVVGSSTRGVMNIRDLVINAIKTDAGVTAGKVAIEITTNVPAADVTVYAAYKVKDEQDRGFVGTFGEHGSAK